MRLLCCWMRLRALCQRVLSGWLADTLARIPDYKITKVDELLPWRWNG